MMYRKLKIILVTVLLSLFCLNTGLPAQFRPAVQAATLSQAYQNLKASFPQTVARLKAADPSIDDSDIESFINDVSVDLQSRGQLTEKNLEGKFYEASLSVILGRKHDRVVDAALSGFGVTWEDILNKRLPPGFQAIRTAVKMELLPDSVKPGSGGGTVPATAEPDKNVLPEVKQEQPAVLFSDVKGHWAEKDILAMAARGVVKGAEGKAMPDDKVTRAQFAVFLALLLDIPGTGRDLPFADVDRSAWYYNKLSAAYWAGLIRGYGDGRIGPGDYISREQMAVMAVGALKCAGKPVPPATALSFGDRESVSSWAAGAVSTVSSAGIIKGFPDNTYRPGENATRAEAIVMLSRLTGKL